jgi:hypothetical protein
MWTGLTLEILLAQSETDDGHHHLKQQLLHRVQQRATIIFIQHTDSSSGYIASNDMMISEKCAGKHVDRIMD